jgi:transcriptional regulator with XRE-family HTH domain
MKDVPQKHRTRWFLKEWREHFGLSGEQLAEIMGTTKGTISKLQHSRSFKTDWIDRYCAALSPLAKRTISARDLARPPGVPLLDDLLEAAAPAEQERARDIVRAFLNVHN